MEKAGREEVKGCMWTLLPSSGTTDDGLVQDVGSGMGGS